MLIKLITNRRNEPRRAFPHLVSYVLQEQKVEWIYRAANLLLKDQNTGIEMELVANQNRRVIYPAYHAVVSWRPTDGATREQMRYCVEELVRRLYCEGHQFLAVAHEDIGHPHVHVVLNRVGLNGGPAAPLGLNKIRVHDLSNELSRQFGWRVDPSPRALQPLPVLVNDEALKFGDVLPAPVGKTLTRNRPFIQKISFQEWLGTEPRARLVEAITMPGTTWHDIHKTLEEFGIEYHRGGALSYNFDATLVAKDTHIARLAEFTRLEQRLGQFEAAALSPPPPYTKQGPYEEYCARHAVPEQLLESYRTHHRATSGERRNLHNRQVASEEARLNELSERLRAAKQGARLDLDLKALGLAKDIRQIIELGGKVELDALQSDFKREQSELKAKVRFAPLSSWLGEREKCGDEVAIQYQAKRREMRTARLQPPQRLIVLSHPPITAATVTEMRAAVQAFGGSVPAPIDAARAYLHGLMVAHDVTQIKMRDLTEHSVLKPIRYVRVEGKALALFHVLQDSIRYGVVLRTSDVRAIARMTATGESYGWDPKRRMLGKPIGDLSIEKTDSPKLHFSSLEREGIRPPF